MRFEERLNIGIAAEEVANADDPSQARPNHRAIFDAILKLLKMDIEAVYDFATSGGYIEESGMVVINGLPSTMLTEQVVTRTVHTGNYTRILEISIDKADPVYKVYIIVKLSVPDDRVNASIQKSMANWTPGAPLPFVYYETEDQALKAMGGIEDKEAGQAHVPTKPSMKQQKTKSSPPVDVKQAAVQVATKMGKDSVVPTLQRMTPKEVLEAAKKGKEQSSTDLWTISKWVFLTYLGFQTLIHGLSGLAALIIGYFAVLFIDQMTRKKEPPQI